MRHFIGFSFIVAAAVVLMSGSAFAQDDDSDTIVNAMDNCVEIPNGPNEDDLSVLPQIILNQVDADLDGYGNACDADYDNNGAVNGADFVTFVTAFNTSNSIIDLTGDGIVDFADYYAFLCLFNLQPGPSGYACAGTGTIPCPPN